jgi:peptidoglycan hydrolase-like protein with peptidoglycan-binding domain
LLQVRVRAVARIAGALAVSVAVVQASPAFAAPKQGLGSRVLKEGMSGSDVAALQNDLTKAGYTTTADGNFGPGTEKNVKAFESRYRLPVNGVVNAGFVNQLLAVDALDAQTSDASAGSGGIAINSGNVKLKVSVKTKPATKTKADTTIDPSQVLSGVLAPVKQDGGSEHLGERTLKQGMAGHDVRVLQSYLTIAGYPTTIDGDFGPATKASTVAWQKASGLTDNGVVTYQVSLDLRQDVAKAMGDTSATPSTTSTSTAPTGKATINPDGTATAPAGAPLLVQEVISAANQIIDKPYVYGGGHASFNDTGYDCSGSVSYALHGANLLSEPEDSTQLETYGDSGPGKWITIYADSGHTWIVVAGIAFDTADYGGPNIPAGTGPRWRSNPLGNLADGGDYVVRHPAGL